MANFPTLAALAERLIKENGRDVTLTRADRTAADPAKPWRGAPIPGTPTSVVARAVFVAGDFGLTEADDPGLLDRRGEQTALVAASSVSPSLIEQFDQILDGAVSWKILRVHVLKPASLTILYGIEVRR